MANFNRHSNSTNPPTLCTPDFWPRSVMRWGTGPGIS